MNSSVGSSEADTGGKWIEELSRRVDQEIQEEYRHLPEGMLWRDSVNPVLREVGATVAKMAAATRRKAINRLQ